MAKADQRAACVAHIKVQADNLQAEFDCEVQLALAQGDDDSDGSRPTTPSAVTMQQAMLSPTMKFSAV